MCVCVCVCVCVCACVRTCVESFLQCLTCMRELYRWHGFRWWHWRRRMSRLCTGNLRAVRWYDRMHFLPSRVCVRRCNFRRQFSVFARHLFLGGAECMHELSR
jgi:hypothetical protein